jgi:hypothetical protein
MSIWFLWSFKFTKRHLDFKAALSGGHWISGTDQAVEGTWISQYTGKPLRYINFYPGKKLSLSTD